MFVWTLPSRKQWNILSPGMKLDLSEPQEEADAQNKKVSAKSGDWDYYSSRWIPVRAQQCRPMLEFPYGKQKNRLQRKRQKRHTEIG
jgi:nitric oxide reductase activation protein